MDADDDDGAGDDAGDGAGDDEAEPANGSGSAETTSAEEGAEADGEFGPNTELVLQFLTKLAALTAAETSELVTAWRRQPKEELRIAHREPAGPRRRGSQVARAAASSPGRGLRLDERAQRPSALLVRRAAEPGRVRETAGPAVARSSRRRPLPGLDASCSRHLRSSSARACRSRWAIRSSSLGCRRQAVTSSEVSAAVSAASFVRNLQHELGVRAELAVGLGALLGRGSFGRA